jgi:hypothetical protein
MADTITKILFRRGLDVQRRLAGGAGVKFNVGEPAFCIDTKRLYIGTGTDSSGLYGGAPIGIRCHGSFTNLFGGVYGYSQTAYQTMTANGIDIGDIVFDNNSSVMYYVSSKNPVSAVPALTDLAAFSLLGQVSGANGVASSKAGPVAVFQLDPSYFTAAGAAFNILTPTTISNTLLVTQNIQGNNQLLIAGASRIQNTLTVDNNISVGGSISVNPYTVGYNSPNWASCFSSVNSNSASWSNAYSTIQGLLPMAWQYNTSTNYISTYGTNYSVGINTTPSFVGLAVKGSSTVATSLSVYGGIVATGDLVAYSTSDTKFKKNQTLISNALEKVKQISGISFDWDCSFKAGHDIGVLAHEVEKVLPEAVIDRGDDGKAVNYEKLIPLLIEAIKELSNR